MRRPSFSATSAAALSLGAIVACSTTARPIGEIADIVTPPQLGSTEQSADASVPGASVGLCPSNECPAGRVTCPNNPFPCAVDLSSDDENCGACGVRCPTDSAFSARFNGTMRCIGGTCQLTCTGTFADCNGRLDDGCEVDISADKAHCGGCGIVCDTVCQYGACGCPPGMTYCEYDGQCHRLTRDNDNCGACAHVCPPDTGPPLPPELKASRTCRGGECNTLGCNSGLGDCNNDLLEPGSDGCETNTRTDPNNCGGCGSVCAPGEVCLFGECKCLCGSSCFTAINTDPYNCGTCGLKCPGDWRSLEFTNAASLDPAHGRPTCEQGVCGYACSPNWADCDGDIENGCETDLLEDPLNCGGCGVRCDGIEGHACVDGECLMKSCEEVK